MGLSKYSTNHLENQLIFLFNIFSQGFVGLFLSIYINPYIYTLFFCQSSLRISPSVPFMSSVPKDPLKLSLASRIDYDSSPMTPPPSATPGNSLSRRWPGASMWPNWDLLDNLEGPFSIEREARLHRQAACMFCY